MSESLADIQQAFQDYILDNENDFVSKVTERTPGEAKLRADIYADMYDERLFQSIAGEYPGVQALCDEEDFEEVVYAYLDNHPSHSYTLRHFCDGFADFLVEKFSEEMTNIFVEMALFEREISRVTEAANAKRVTLAHLQALPQKKWPGMKLHFHPSVRMLEMSYNIDELWLAVNRGETLPEIYQSEETRLIKLWRQGKDPMFHVCDVPERWLLSEAMAGKTYARMCESLCEIVNVEDVPQVALDWLVTWINQEMIHKLN